LPIAFRFLCILLAAIPVLAITDDWLTQSVSAITSAVLLLFAIAAPQDDLAITVQLLRRIRLAILFPIAWMVLQIAPFNLLANSIWPTASVALDDPLSGHISIDPGATIRSLFAYFAAVSLMVVTMVYTRERERAETILIVICGVTVFMSAEMLLGQFVPLPGIIPKAGQPGMATFVAIEALGAIANAAAAFRVMERRLSRREDGPGIPSVFIALAGSASCLGAIMTAGTTNILILAGAGIAIIILVGLSRLFALPPWSAGIFVAIFALAATGAVAARFEDYPTVTAILRFATGASSDSLSVTQRALADVKWFGNGVGTFDTLAPIYRDFGSQGAVEPASTMAKIAIEWGRAALIVLLLMAIQLFVTMFLGALRRGRDWFFSAAGSASVVLLFCQAFCDSNLTHPSSQIIVAVIIGLGLSQTISRTSGL
jgi:hypothetical protein